MDGAGSDAGVGRPDSDVSRFPGTMENLTSRLNGQTLVGGMRSVFAMLSLAGGLYALVIGWPYPADLAYYPVFGTAAVLGGVCLLLAARPGWRIGWRGWAWVAFLAVVGTTFGLVISTDGVCCMHVYSVHRGYPFRWLHDSTELPSLMPTQQARTVMLGRPDAVSRTVDWAVAAVDALFWAYLGVVFVVATRLIRRAVAALGGEAVGARP
ncbi:MAG TPA: hypothetical protein VGJ63_08930 [Micromonosporaceae bacterium]|jgi:hypothetical protein